LFLIVIYYRKTQEKRLDHEKESRLQEIKKLKYPKENFNRDSGNQGHQPGKSTNDEHTDLRVQKVSKLRFTILSSQQAERLTGSMENNNLQQHQHKKPAAAIGEKANAVLVQVFSETGHPAE